MSFIPQGWPLWAVSDEGSGRNIYAVVGWEDWQPVGIMIGGEFESHQAAELLRCRLALFGELGDARRAATEGAVADDAGVELRTGPDWHEVLLSLIDPDPCYLDHHGNCQAHGWLKAGECPQSRAKRLVGYGQQ